MPPLEPMQGKSRRVPGVLRSLATAVQKQSSIEGGFMLGFPKRRQVKDERIFEINCQATGGKVRLKTTDWTSRIDGIEEVFNFTALDCPCGNVHGGFARVPLPVSVVRF